MRFWNSTRLTSIGRRVHLVHQRRRLQRIIRSLLAHVALCQTMELVIDERHKSVRRAEPSPWLHARRSSVGPSAEFGDMTVFFLLDGAFI